MGRFNHQLTKTHFKGWGHRVIQSQNQPIGEAMMDLFLSDTWLPRCQIIDILCEQKVGRCLIQGSWRYHPHHRRFYLLLSLLLLAFACPLQWTLSVFVCQYDSNYVVFSPYQLDWALQTYHPTMIPQIPMQDPLVCSGVLCQLYIFNQRKTNMWLGKPWHIIKLSCWDAEARTPTCGIREIYRILGDPRLP